MTLLSRERKKQVLTACERIYEALCAEDMDGAFRSAYILKQTEEIRFQIDKSRKGRKRYAIYKSRLRNPH